MKTDRESIRIQAAIAALQGVMSNPAFCNVNTSQDFPVKVAIAVADKLVAELNKEKKE